MGKFGGKLSGAAKPISAVRKFLKIAGKPAHAQVFAKVKLYLNTSAFTSCA